MALFLGMRLGCCGEGTGLLWRGDCSWRCGLRSLVISKKGEEIHSKCKLSLPFLVEASESRKTHIAQKAQAEPVTSLSVFCAQDLVRRSAFISPCKCSSVLWG